MEPPSSPADAHEPLALPASGDAPAPDAVATAVSLYDMVHRHLRAYFAAHGHGLPASGLYDRVIKIVERPLIELTLDATGGNQLKAAHILGINRNTLRKKITELAIDVAKRGGADG